MKKILLILPFLFLVGIPTYSSAGWFGSDTYEECLLDEVGDARTKEAVREIKKACKKRHPEGFWRDRFERYKQNYPKVYGNLSDCEIVKKMKRLTNNRHSDSTFVDMFGVNPSKCD
jgi:hypothetical protein